MKKKLWFRTFGKLSRMGLTNWIPDRQYLKIMYYGVFGKKLNLENPRTFNEKLQWLKLYDRDKLYTTMVDKCEVKNYVANIIGSQYVIPTLGVWNHFDEIDFTKLPEQFVLKCTHDSGGVVICKDVHYFDRTAAKEKLENHLKHNYYYAGREWPYKNVKPRIIAETYMEDASEKALNDFKFFCFDGVVKALFIATERQNKNAETCFDFFDAEFRHLDIRNGHPNAKITPQRPEQFELMKSLAEKLSKGFPELRVDFYQVNGKVYFGELTFSHWNGFTPFEPEKWDLTFGNWITLPDKKSK